VSPIHRHEKEISEVVRAAVEAGFGGFDYVIHFASGDVMEDEATAIIIAGLEGFVKNMSVRTEEHLRVVFVGAMCVEL